MLGILKVLAWLVGIPAVAIAILYFTMIDFWEIPTDDPELLASIAPNLQGGELVVVSKETAAEIPNLARCQHPEKPEQFVIGRLLARSGENLTVLNDIANAKGRRQPAGRRCEPASVEVTGKGGEKRNLECWEENYENANFNILRSSDRPSAQFTKVVEQGMVFIISDNRTLHQDSRDFGPVAAGTCRRIYFRVWGEQGISDPRFSWVW